jgi:predicted RNase H-like HicB family nuclease
MGGSSLAFVSTSSVKNQMEMSITTFAPEPYAVIFPIRVTLIEEDEGFSASYMEANIHSTGDNEFDAFENLKSLILDVFESLTAERPENLGPKAKNQLAVLRESIQPA